MGKEYTKKMFDEQIKTKFRVKGNPASAVELELIETTDKSRTGMRAFTLILKGPREPVLEDNSYEMKHPELGTLWLFISPYKQTKDAAYYDVQFTNLLEEE
jgi:hypothetical protein